MKENTEELDSLCKGLSFTFEKKLIKVKNYTDLVEYIKKINKKSQDIKENDSLEDYKTYEGGLNRFISLFKGSINFCFESINASIKHTKELKIKLTSEKRKENYINNVFILNHEKDKFCYEIKLGHGQWDTFYESKEDLNITPNPKNQINNKTFKIGLLRINKYHMINPYMSFNRRNVITFVGLSKEKEENYDIGFLDETDKEILLQDFLKYQKSIYYSFDLNNLIKKINEDNNKNTDFKISKLHKNDTIGIVVDKKYMKGYIRFNIFINGVLVDSRTIKNIQYEYDYKHPYTDIEDEYNEDVEIENNEFLISFIELGPNNSIFIKDKPSNNKIISNEKMDFYDMYNCPPLNEFPKNIEEIQKITDYYLDIMMKVGSKIICLNPEILNEQYFQNLISNFESLILINKIIVKNKIINFLSHDLTPNDMTNFKNNFLSLFLIIQQAEKIKEKELIKIIIELYIELISEKNFNLLNLVKINNFSENLILELIRLKFSLCFILFDEFMKEEKNIKLISNNLVEVLLNKYRFFMNFCFSIFDNILYVDPSYANNFIKEIGYDNDNFNKNKFILFNFKNSSNKNNLIFDYIVQYYDYIIRNIIAKHFLYNEKQIEYFTNFLLLKLKFQDNFSIINGILRPFIYYFKLENSNIKNNISIFIEKLLYINYAKKIYNICKPKDSFFGKSSSSISIKLNIGNDINEKDKALSLIFRLVLICISKYYENFLKLKNNNNFCIDFFNNSQVDNINESYLNNLSLSIEFYQVIFSYQVYNKLLYYSYYFSEILMYSIKNKFLQLLPFNEFLYNIFFILDFLDIRCAVIDKDNLIDKDEPYTISIILQNILKFAIFFLSNVVQKLNRSNFTKTENYYKMIYLNIIIFIRILKFDINIFINIISEIKDELKLTIKNLFELSNIKENNIINNAVKKLIEYLYSYGVSSDHYAIYELSLKENLFTSIMKDENKAYKPINSKLDICHKNNYIKNTMYYNFFMIIYNRIKILRNSLNNIINKNTPFLDNELIKIYIVKLTYEFNKLNNFLVENELFICYDIQCILFLKINSFLCKTFKCLLNESNMKNLYAFSLHSTNYDEITYQFFQQLFLVFLTILYNKNYSHLDYYKNFLYELSKNRKGFHFKEVKDNIIKYFKDNKKYTNLIDLLNNKITPFFESICKEEDTTNENEVNDNSIEIESRIVCSICQMDTPELDAHLKGCNHEYHIDCLKQLIKSNGSCSKKCPLCKRPITGIKEDPNFKIEQQNNQINLSNVYFFDNNNFHNRGRERNGYYHNYRRNNYWRNNNRNYQISH
mgnify:CR=1 FL=1